MKRSRKREVRRWKFLPTSSITWRTGDEATGNTPVMYAYNYDNSYQLTGATFGTPDYAAGTFTASANQYKVENLAYDPNGNIKGLNRYNGEQELQEDFDEYNYETNTNKLSGISDDEDNGYASYAYNAIGQLQNEVLLKAGPNNSDITRTLTYNVSGKVDNVTIDGEDETGSAYSKDITYKYDDRGFRLMKRDGEGKETWYIRDAGGNVLATYEKDAASELEIKETMIYGNDRIGMYKHDFVKLDPEKEYIFGDEVRYAYEDKDYEILPDASLKLTGGFTFTAGEKTFEAGTVTEDEILGATEYELNDHLGNVRIAMSQERTSFPFDENLEDETSSYMNVTETRHQDVNYNHTPEGSWSSWLNPAATGGQEVGPAITLHVSPGDTVEIKAFGMYREQADGNTNLVTSLATALAGGFDPGSAALEANEAVSLFSSLLSGGAAFVEPPADSNVPHAYLNYIVFDKHFNAIESSSDAIPLTDAASNDWEELSGEVPIQTNGYIYIYVANETMDDVNVHFDDIEVTLIESPANHASDYYPFGLVMDGRSWSSEPYRFGYQGQFSEYDEETGWNAFEARMYDSEIGRWLSTDPAGQFASPYLAMGNSPIIGVDPDGQYSRFGAWWRSFYIRDSYTYNVGGDEWAIGWSEWRQDDQGAYLYTYSITEGGPGIGKESFEGLAFDAGFNFELTLGAQKVRDYGLTGFDVNLGSATLFEFKPQLSWEYGKGWEGSRLGINYFGKDNKVKITQGIRYEGGVDLKANAVYEYDLVNGKLTRINNSFGIGAPGIEGKFTHDKVHGMGKVRVGLQEDVGRSIPVGAGLELGVRSGAYIRGGFNAK